MDRVQIAALSLAALLFVVWFMTLPQGSREPAPGAPPQAPAEVSPTAPPRAEAAPLEPPAFDASPPDDDATRQETMAEAQIHVLENDALRLEVSSLGARLRSIQLKGYRDRLGPEARPVELVTASKLGTLVVSLGSGPLAALHQRAHRVVSASSGAIQLELEEGGVRVLRRIALDDTGYGAWLRVRMENHASQTLRPEFQVAWYGAERAPGAPDRLQRYSLAVYQDGSVSRRPLQGLGSRGFWDGLLGRSPWAGAEFVPVVEWAGIDSQYFLTAAIPENPDESRGIQRPLAPNAGLAALEYPAFDVPPGRYVERSYRLYLGPKVVSQLVAVDPRLDASIQAGWTLFRPLVDLFAWLLKWTYQHVVSNYGIAIILLTILLRLITFPLTQKSMKSMQRMQKIGPEMKALQEKHADDRARLQEEMMALYRRKGMNPFSALGGGCLPMLIQFPFLIALYFALQASIELRHAPFILWIRDLSAPEELLRIASVPIRVLPLAMGGTMFLQQRLTPSAGVDPQQRQMMMWMSVLFLFLFYRFPSGLVLYWFVSNLLGIAQQILVNRQAGRREDKA